MVVQVSANLESPLLSLVPWSRFRKIEIEKNLLLGKLGKSAPFPTTTHPSPPTNSSGFTLWNHFKIFLDVDECSNGDAKCGVHAICSNTQGGYDCVCKDGYQGNGKTCTGTYHVSWIYRFNELKIFKRYWMLYCMFWAVWILQYMVNGFCFGQTSFGGQIPMLIQTQNSEWEMRFLSRRKLKKICNACMFWTVWILRLRYTTG